MKAITINSKAVTDAEVRQTVCVFSDTLQEHAPFMNDVDWQVLAAMHSFDNCTASHQVNTMFFAANQAKVEHELPNGARIRFDDLMERSNFPFARYCRAALHHDIGKIMIPKEVLFQKGKLSEEDRAIVASHEKASSIILKSLNLDVEARIAGQHHNNDQQEMECQFYIPELRLWVAVADLLHLADVQEALLRNRVYRPSLTPLEALRIMVEQSKDGKIGRELTCLWVKEEMRKLSGSYLNRLESSAWREIQNLLFIRSFLAVEWKNLKQLCQQPSVAEVYPYCELPQAACWA
jgi:HD-GYP domain-containing protein (c-di-GMP phosphodiesterase class II)